MTTSTAPWVDALISSDTLSELVGYPARMTRVRVKAHTSIAGAIRYGTDPAERFGWVRILWPTSRDKARRPRAAARKIGLDLSERELPGGLLLQAGPLRTDPLLARHLARAQLSSHTLWLRHNPLRRAVGVDGSTIVKISAAAHNTLIEIEKDLTDLPVPTFEAASNARGAVHISRRPLIKGRDLSVDAPLWAHEQAGRILASIHDHEPPRAARRPGRSLRVALDNHRRLLRVLAPTLARRLESIDPPDPTFNGETVFSHGDASPDQFLLDEHHNVWVTDFDRACCAPRNIDLASYAYCCTPEQAEAFTSAYCAAGGRMPTPNELDEGRIIAVIDRLLDPLRDARPTWRHDIGASLELLERLV